MTSKKILLVSGLLLLSIGAPSATVTVAVAPNVNITKAAGNQANGTIAINPTSPLELFAANNPTGPSLSLGPAYSRSADGGTTWIPAGAGITATCCGGLPVVSDQVAAWDWLGNLFLVNVKSDTSAIALYLSIDSGANFTLLSTIATGSVGFPSVKAAAGSVWVTWNDSGTVKARGAAVTGLGAVGPFTLEQAAPGTPGQSGDIAIGPSGQVVVAYQSSNSPCPCQILANTDPDGLGPLGFGPQVIVSSTNVNALDFIPAQHSRSIDAEANLAWDQSGGLYNGRLYLSYTDEAPDESNDTNILVRSSDDDGATWSPAVLVNDDATTTSQFNPNISVDQITAPSP